MGNIEVLKFDYETEQYFIEREVNNNGLTSYQKLPLSQWGFVKKIEVIAHIQRRLETKSFEKPIQVINYSLPITYEINDSGKNIYLKVTEKTFDMPAHENPKNNWISVMFRDLENQVTQEVPLPNDLYDDAYPFLKITRGIATELTKAEVIALWKSGKCLGTFDFDLKNRL